MKERENRPPSPRQLRVGEAIRHALAHVIERGEIRDPGLGGKSVTVTEVRVSPDLRHATAFVVPFAAAAEKDAAKAMTEVVAALNRAAPFLRHRVVESVQTRLAPEIVFRPDTTFEEAERIHRLFADPRVAADLRPPPPGRAGLTTRAKKVPTLPGRSRGRRKKKQNDGA